MNYGQAWNSLVEGNVYKSFTTTDVFPPKYKPIKMGP